MQHIVKLSYIQWPKYPFSLLIILYISLPFSIIINPSHSNVWCKQVEAASFSVRHHFMTFYPKRPTPTPLLSCTFLITVAFNCLPAHFKIRSEQVKHLYKPPQWVSNGPWELLYTSVSLYPSHKQCRIVPSLHPSWDSSEPTLLCINITWPHNCRGVHCPNILGNLYDSWPLKKQFFVQDYDALKQRIDISITQHLGKATIGAHTNLIN